MAERPCPECGKGCVACWKAGASYLEPVVRDYEAWLGAALIALGVKDVFHIPNWKVNLKRSLVEIDEEARAAVAALQELERG